MDNQVTYFSLAFFPFCPYTISMLSLKIGLPQYKNSPPKAQIPAYFQKIVDTRIIGNTITQQLSNSATQQLSNSATQQLSNSASRLCPDKRAAFTFRQQHHYIFSSTFADGKRAVSVFNFTHRRHFAALGIFCALGMQRSCPCKVIITRSFYRNARQAVWVDSG